MFTLALHATPRTSFMAIAAIAIVAGASLSTPAAAAKTTTGQVVAACKRTAGCSYNTDGGQYVWGCSPHACFFCSDGGCNEHPHPPAVKRNPVGTGRGVEGTTGNTGRSLASGRAPAKPIVIGASGHRKN